MFNLLAGDAYCYFNGHYLILKFSECQCVLEGGCDCLADRVPDPVISFPRTPFSTAGTAAALARLSIHATARLKVQKLPCSLGRAQECRAIAWKEMRSAKEFFLPDQNSYTVIERLYCKRIELISQ